MTQAATRTRTLVQALNEALDIAMARDPNVYMLGEDIGEMGGDFGVTRGLWAKYGTRACAIRRSPKLPSLARRLVRR
jgi:hypothetical protein